MNMKDKRFLRIDDFIQKLVEIKKEKGNIMVTLISPAWEDDCGEYPETYEGLVDDDVKVIHDDILKDDVVAINTENIL